MQQDIEFVTLQETCEMQHKTQVNTYKIYVFALLVGGGGRLCDENKQRFINIRHE